VEPGTPYDELSPEDQAIRRAERSERWADRIAALDMTKEMSGPYAELDDEGLVVVRHITSDESWELLVGPFGASSAVAARLEISEQEVIRRVRSGQILGLCLNSEAKTLWVFPIWQLTDPVLSSLPDILGAAGYDADRPVTQWTIAGWLVSPNTLLGERRPLDLLTEGDVASVLRVAAEVSASVGVAESGTRD
jgi:hypothetical protein